MSAILKQKLIDIANGFTKYGLWKGGGNSNLSELDDVTLTNLQSNDVLTYNGSKWVNDNNLQTQINTLNSNLSECVKGNIPFKGVKIFAAFTNISSAPANSYYEQADNLENYLPYNAKIIFGVASILGTLTPFTDVEGPTVRLYNDYPKTIGFRIYNKLSYSIDMKIAYICFYIET